MYTGLHSFIIIKGNVKVKAKVILERATKTRGEQIYSSAFPLTSALDGEGVSTTSWPFYFREIHGTRCTRGWVGPRVGLDGCGKSRPHRDSIPGPSSL